MKTRLFVSLLAIFSILPLVHGQSIRQVTSEDAAKMLTSDKGLIVLDVRTAEEFREGHIKGAINIDIRQPDALSRIDKLDHNARYIVHCRTNHRSKIAVDHMVIRGFKTVYQMMDGFSGWSANGLPQVK